MSPVEAFKSYAPSVAHLVFFQGDQRISSGSGFLVRDRLVTCAHVVERMGANHMKVRFPYAEAGQTQEWDVPAGVQSLTFCGFSGEQSYDYAIIDPPAYVAIGPSLSFAEEETEVGGQVCGLGFPFERDELSLCVGYVSAAVNSGVARLLKLDMSVNPSNSGGPLIDLASGKVVGVIARKSTGLTGAFLELQRSFDANLAALSQAGGIIMSGIDPFAVMRATQQQMKIAMKELERSAQVGIGWAVYVDPLRSELVFNS